MSTAAVNALEALRGRFDPPALAVVAAQPYPNVLRSARERRADALLESRWAETPESEQETPVIVALDAFIRDRNPTPHTKPWEGGLA